jgi:hypothetical protein
MTDVPFAGSCRKAASSLGRIVKWRTPTGVRSPRSEGVVHILEPVMKHIDR